MKIDAYNVEKINDEIEKVQARAQVRLIDASDVVNEIKWIENKLKDLLYKKDWVGLIFDVDVHAQHFPGAYRGTPESTAFRVMRTKSGWFVISIFRTITGTHAIHPFNLDTKKDEIARFISKPINW